MIWNPKWFPGTNLQDLNLDWILKKISALRGGTAGQYLYKKSNKDFDFGWKTGSGGGTSDYLYLDNKPSINNVELDGNKTASDLGLASASDIPVVPVQSVNGKTGAVELTASDVGAYVKPATGIPETDLSSAVQASLDKADTALQAVPPTYRTAAAQDAIDTGFAKTNEVGIVINGKRPARNASAGQYVIVRNSTISGISDGLYVVKSGHTLSPSTDVTAASLSTWNIGGLNGLILTQSTGTYSPSATYISNEGSVRTYGKLNIFTILLQVSSGTIPANTYTNIGTITPRPNARMNTTTQDSYGTLILVDIMTDGTVRIYCYNNAMNGTMRTQLSYFAN